MGSLRPHRFRIDRVVITGHDGNTWFDESFYDGTNVIYGLSESGKTPLLLLIRRAFGMDVEYKPALSKLLSSVKVDFSLDEQHLRVDFDIRRANWSLYRSEAGLGGTLLATDSDAIQAYILNSLEIPLEKVPDSRNQAGYKVVGLPSIFGAMYVNQKHGYNSIITQNDSKTRRIAFETLLGLDLSAKATRLEFTREVTARRLEDLATEERHYQNVKRKLGLEDEVQLKTNLEAERIALADLEATYQRLQESPTPVLDSGLIDSLRDDLEDIQRQLNIRVFERSGLDEAISQCRANRRVAAARLRELEQVDEAEGILSAFAFTQCPRCHRPVTSDMQEKEQGDPTECMLCGRELPTRTERTSLLELEDERIRLEAELNLQEENIRSYDSKLGLLSGEIRVLKNRAEDLRHQLSRMTEAGPRPGVQEMAGIHARIDQAKMRVYQLELKLRLRELVEPVELEIEALNAQVTDAQNELDRLRSSEEGASLAQEEATRLEIFLGECQQFIDMIFRDRRKLGFEKSGQRRYMPRLDTTRFEDLGANEPYRIVLAYYLSMMAVSLQSETRFPRFLVFDTPRQHDADDWLFGRVIDAVRSLEERFGTEFQIIMTGSDAVVKDAASSTRHLIEVPPGEKILRPPHKQMTFDDIM